MKTFFFAPLSKFSENSVFPFLTGNKEDFFFALHLYFYRKRGEFYFLKNNLYTFWIFYPNYPYRGTDEKA